MRLARIPLTALVVWLALMASVPYVMSLYAPYVVRPGISCVRTAVLVRVDRPYPPGMCKDLAQLYHVSFPELFVDALGRSVVLLVGAAILGLVVGTLLGAAAALARRGAVGSGVILALMSVLSAVPAFFVAYFLQILVVIVGATASGGNLLPVFGFGYDAHVVLPLLSISIPAIAFTAQLTATRTAEVLDADFIVAARAKGLRTRWLLAVHVLPHVRPVILEALASGLRVSVASLPIVEYLFVWRGIGQLAVEAVGVHDSAGLIFAGVALATLFGGLSAIADVSRPRAVFAT